MFVSKHRCGGVPKKLNGFTVIEIIIAIIILGILATLSINMMRDYKIHQNVDSSRQQFINAITIAAAAASKYNVNYSVVFRQREGGPSGDILVCATTAASSCTSQNAEFYSNLIAFSRSCPSVNGAECIEIPSTSPDSSDFYLVITPFGHVLSNIGTDSNNNNRLFFVDGDRRVTAQNGSAVCLGVELYGNGAVETVDIASSASGTCG